MPEGEKPIMPPTDKMGGSMMPMGETSTKFTISKGSNYFSNVCPDEF